MSDLKHTPGPWMILFGCDEDEIEIVGNADERSVPVADIMLDEHTTFAPPMTEARANARLIVAAPDLLAALELAMGSTDHDSDLSEWRTDAIAAIAKARGLM